MELENDREELQNDSDMSLEFDSQNLILNEE